MKKPKNTHSFNFQFKKDDHGKVLEVIMSVKDYEIMERKVKEWDKITKNFRQKKKPQD